ncbi:MAG: hypothetical protein ACJ8FY_03355 [Gemmataceae bacterium]
MLEYSRLLLHLRSASKRQAGSPPPIVLGEIVEPVERLALGTIRQQRRRPRWWPLGGQSSLAIHEQDDNPLLFTIHRLWTWPRAWEIRDADGTVVGRTRRGVILPWQSLITAISAVHQGQTLIFLTPAGKQLGTLLSQEEGLLLAFAEELHEDPLTKMLLLGAVLGWNLLP